MKKLSFVAAALSAGGLAIASGPVQAAPAPPKADVTVTITAEGTDMSGVVKSPRPGVCAANRTVKVFKVIDGVAHLYATDTTDFQGGQYVWSTGNTGQPGRYFAKVGGNANCQSDVSPTIRTRRNPN